MQCSKKNRHPISSSARARNVGAAPCPCTSQSTHGPGYSAARFSGACPSIWPPDYSFLRAPKWALPTSSVDLRAPRIAGTDDIEKGGRQTQRSLRFLGLLSGLDPPKRGVNPVAGLCF